MIDDDIDDQSMKHPSSSVVDETIGHRVRQNNVISCLLRTVVQQWLWILNNI